MSTILILNGPNLNLLGEREPEIYGHDSLKDISDNLDKVAKKIDVTLNHQQFNSESELIDTIHIASKEKIVTTENRKSTTSFIFYRLPT